MTGRIRGVATRLEASVPAKKLVRAWCALHQLDLVMQRVHKSSSDEEFLSTVTSMTGHLRRQSTLILKMGSTCPLVADTRWLSWKGSADGLLAISSGCKNTTRLYYPVHSAYGGGCF